MAATAAVFLPVETSNLEMKVTYQLLFNFLNNQIKMDLTWIRALTITFWCPIKPILYGHWKLHQNMTAKNNDLPNKDGVNIKSVGLDRKLVANSDRKPRVALQYNDPGGQLLLHVLYLVKYQWRISPRGESTPLGGTSFRQGQFLAKMYANWVPLGM